jgi:hypothetical protein
MRSFSPCDHGQFTDNFAARGSDFITGRSLNGPLYPYYRLLLCHSDIASVFFTPPLPLPHTHIDMFMPRPFR